MLLDRISSLARAVSTQVLLHFCFVVHLTFCLLLRQNFANRIDVPVFLHFRMLRSKVVQQNHQLEMSARTRGRTKSARTNTLRTTPHTSTFGNDALCGVMVLVY